MSKEHNINQMNHPSSSAIYICDLEKLTDQIPTGIGIYTVYADNRLELNYLNDGYYKMIGSSRNDRTQYFGFAITQVIYPDDLPALMCDVRNAISEQRPLNTDLRILDGSGNYMWINIQANIIENTAEKAILYCSYTDINDRKLSLMRLAASQHAIALAGKAGGISFWQYDIDRHIFSQRDYGDSLFGYDDYMENFPDCVIESGAIHPDDLSTFKEVYRQLEADVLTCECTVRFLNKNSHHYDWHRIVYSRLDHEESDTRIAVGFACVVNLQIENQVRYEHEAQLRHELNKNALNYFQVNLATRTLVEFHSRFSTSQPIVPPLKITMDVLDQLLKDVAPEHLNKVRSSFLANSLIDSYLRGETHFSLEYQRKLPGIGLHWVKADCTIIKHPYSDELVAFVSTKDIEQEKTDHEALSCILDEEIESIILLNTANRQVHIVMEKQIWDGKTPGTTFIANEHFTQTLLQDVIPEDCRKCAAFIKPENLIHRLETRKILRITYRMKGDGGRILRKKVRAFYLNDNKQQIVIARRDITDLYEEEQRQKQVLQQAIDEANAANAAKTEFLSRVSHDMRTPMNGILGLSALSKQENDVDVLKYNIGKIEESGNYLLSLINDTLDFQRIESGRIRLEPQIVQTASFISGILDIVKPAAQKKNIQFKVHSQMANMNSYIRIDPLRVKQICINLLSNAIKFTPEHGTVQFDVECTKRDENHVHDIIRISDTGIGMSKEFMEKDLFKPFSQESNKITTQYAGSGLGLSIAKKLVELMGGTIAVESELGTGTTFVVNIDFNLVPEHEWEKIVSSQKKEEESLIGNLSGKHILLVEDHPLNAEIAKKLLTHVNCIVDWAANGQMGVDAFSNSSLRHYDAVLMDIRMPVMTGLEAAKAIRALPRSDAKTVPIIAMTANAYDTDIQQSLDAGMNEHLAKPIVPQKLYAVLSKYIAANTFSHREKILVVDDVPVNSSIIEMTLEDRFDILTATDGLEALEQLRSHSDIIAVITDIQMPHMDGIELIREIRQNPMYDHISIIANTQYGDNYQEEQLLSIGADDLIYKPTKPALVKRRLRNVLMRRH